MPVNSFVDHPLSWTPPEGVKKARAVYLALAAAIEEDILAGVLTPGTKLPPQRELADFLDLDFTTVTRAYNLCREKGLIYGVTGRGTFVAARDAGGSETIDCAVVHGFPEIGADDIAAAARAVIAGERASRLFSYRDRDGSESAVRAGRLWLKLCGADAPSERIAVFPGAQGAISAVLFSLFRPGDAVAVDEFTYANFISLARLAHLKLVAIASDRNGMRADLLTEAAKRFGIKGVFLMPCSANPTGLTLSERRKAEIARIAVRENLLVIEDDARLCLPEPGERTIFALAPENTVYIAGSTRNIAPGLRATFCAFPRRLSAQITGALHHLTIKAGALDSEILAEVILSGGAERILQKKAQAARSANSIFEREFPHAPKAPATAMFRVLPLPGTSGRGQEIESRCREAGVAVCHSDRFAVGPGRHDAFLRVSVSSAASPARLRKGLRLLAKAVTRPLGRV